MILIAYINILSANEKFEMPSTSPNTLAILPFTLIIFIGLLPDFYKTIKISKISNYANALYLNNNSILTLFLMMYLLIAIICVVKIVKCERGPLNDYRKITIVTMDHSIIKIIAIYTYTHVYLY